MSASSAIDSTFHEVQAKSSASEYRPDVDGLRAIAALAVLVGHAGWMPGGGAGVDVFFVISGFLISGIIFRGIKGGNFSFLDFYARRVKRIFPALLVLLLVVWFAGAIILTPEQYSRLGADIAAGAGFSQNIWFYLTIAQRTQTPDYLLTHLWTLGIEEQFYLIWPVFLWGIARLQRGQLFLIVSLTVLSFAYYAWTRPGNGAAALLPWNRLWELSLGGALAYAQARNLLKTQCRAVALTAPFLTNIRFPVASFIAAIGLSCLVLSLRFPVATSPVVHALLPAIGSFLLIAAGPQSWFNRCVLSSRVLVLIGLMSYPLYLWHVSLFVFLPILNGVMPMAEYQQVPLWSKIAATALCIVLSYLTYRYVELPIRSSGRTKQVAITLSVAMALCGLLAFLVSR